MRRHSTSFIGHIWIGRALNPELLPITCLWSQAIVKITDLYFCYKKAARPVFQGLNLEIKAGERVAILGPSEAGKSTLALCLQGLIPRMIKGDFRGRVEVDGCLTATCRPRQLAGRVGILLQDFEAQIFSTRVDQEVAFGPENLGLPREELRQRVGECLDLMGLAGLDDRDPATLSGGQKQLLALAAVLALAHRVIILDEPTTGLDHREQQDLLDLVRELHAQGHTVIMVTHSMWAAATYARRLVVLFNGRVLLDDPAREVLADEALLARARLAPPAVVQLSRALGFTALTPAEFRDRVGGRA